jgi:hypothetical protein
MVSSESANCQARSLMAGGEHIKASASGATRNNQVIAGAEFAVRSCRAQSKPGQTALVIELFSPQIESMRRGKEPRRNGVEENRDPVCNDIPAFSLPININCTAQLFEQPKRATNLFASDSLLDQLERLPVAISKPYVGNSPLILIPDKPIGSLDLRLDDDITGNATADLPNLNLLRPEIGSTEAPKQFTNLFDIDLLRRNDWNDRNEQQKRHQREEKLSDHNPLQKLKNSKTKWLKRESATNTRTRQI